MTMRFVASAVLGGLVVLTAMASCGDAQTAETCTNVPAGGCPIARGVACEDPACEAVYACRPGNVWELERRCPPREGGAGEAGAPDAAADAPSEATRPFDASIDAPPGAAGGPGCASLQAPDCALALALACPSGCCGCEDLFVCESGGWTYWSTCTE